MKKIFLCGIVAASVLFASCCNNSNNRGGEMQSSSLITDVDTLAYVIGFDMGSQVKSIDSTLNIYMIACGIRDYFENKGLISRDDIQKFMQEYFAVRVPAKNAKASKKYLAQIEKEKGVVKTKSGLLYKVIEKGLEDRPTSLEDTVVVHYKGMDRNGKIYESSYKSGLSLRLPLNRVIKGWSEGLQYVGKGGRIILYVPAELAYGEKGVNGSIEVEVLKSKVPLIVPKNNKNI
jgi:FKBP-type peptidyl-prolyl cis-trans isomerase FkpA